MADVPDSTRRNQAYTVLVRSRDYLAGNQFMTATIETLRVRVNYVQSAWERLEGEHERLMAEAADEEVRTAHEELFTRAEELYINVCGKLRTRIAELEPVVQPIPEVQQPAQQPIVQNLPPETLSADLQVAKNTCGYFDGDFTKWQGFRDRFIAAVHDNVRIPDVFKLQQLKSSVRGAAERVLGTWQLTEANYAAAWNCLREVYDDEYQIVQAHLRALDEMPRLERASNEGIRQLIDTTKESVRQLSTLNVPVQHWDLMLVYMLLRRLDEQNAEAWEMQREVARLPTLQEMLTFLERRARVLAHSEPESTLSRQSSTSSLRSKGKTTSKPVVKPSSSGVQSKPELRCYHCGEEHPVFKCKKFMALSIASRKELVERWKLCSNCLSAKHSVERCQAGACRRCGNKEKHNSILCSRLRSVVQVVTNQKTDSKKRPSPDSPGEDREGEKKK